MRVEESDVHECELKLEDISEEEYQAMFLEGMRALVAEARDGKVDDYIVLPYEDTPDEVRSKSTTSIEISDEDTDALVQIGAVSMIKRGLKMAETEAKYWKNLKEMVEEDSGEEWDEDRMDIVGLNGNDGLHYDEESKEGM